MFPAMEQENITSLTQSLDTSATLKMIGLGCSHVCRRIYCISVAIVMTTVNTVYCGGVRNFMMDYVQFISV